MHYYLYFSNCLESRTDFTTFVDNTCGILLDVSILFFTSFLFITKNNRIPCIICFVITWIWSFSNVLYSRFFHHYLTISAISQGKAISDGIIIRCIIDNIIWIDVYFILIVLLFLFITKSQKIEAIIIRKRVFLYLICLLFVVELSVHACYVFVNSTSSNWGYYRYRMNTIHANMNRYSLQPNYIHFVRGSFRALFIDIYNSINGTITLSEEKKAEIESYIKSSRNNISGKYISKPENIIFILIESYMSFVSDIRINGLEVTPFLNSLQHDPSVYFNRHMQENVTIGESSDGQFIYVTGLLPLHSRITISKAKDNTLPSLPKLMKRESRMIIPTISSMWEQDEMCTKYGFMDLFTSFDYSGKHGDDLNDEQVFQLAMQKDIESHERFFSFIITMSMHQPYTEQMDTTFHISTSKTISNELACYLNACHYTDQQIKNYFNHLKLRNIYNNSLIVIASDHAVHCSDFGGVCQELPFYIINAKGLPKDMMWNKRCNQVDVYPTLIDILGIKCDWNGFGYSLLSNKFADSISEKKWELSRWIILSDYFSSIGQNYVFSTN